MLLNAWDIYIYIICEFGVNGEYRSPTIGIKAWLHFPFSPKPFFLINTNKRSKARGRLGMPLQTSFRHHLAPARDTTQGTIIGVVQTSFQVHSICGSGIVRVSFSHRSILAPLMTSFSNILRHRWGVSFWRSLVVGKGVIWHRFRAFHASFSSVPNAGEELHFGVVAGILAAPLSALLTLREDDVILASFGGHRRSI